MNEQSIWTLTVIDSEGMEEVTIEATAAQMGDAMRVLAERGDYVSMEARQVMT